MSSPWITDDYDCFFFSETDEAIEMLPAHLLPKLREDPVAQMFRSPEGLEVRFNVIPGLIYALDVSEDLVHWTEIERRSAVRSLLSFQQPVSSANDTTDSELLIIVNPVTPELLLAIRREYQLHWRGIHGISHWERVINNGLTLAKSTGASVPVVYLFGVFHDSKRLNEDWDPDHGKRGADFARQLHGKYFVLPAPELELLCTACADHTKGLIQADVTIQTCWDGDRLDLGRVGIRPEAQFLCTEPARRPEIINDAYERSVRNYDPKLLAGEPL